jgi:hypothetical protein
MYRRHQPCRRRTAHRQSAGSRRSPPLHQRRRCRYHHCPQTQRRTAGSSRALRQAQCQVHRPHTRLRYRHSPSGTPRTSAHPPWARSPQRTGCTLRSRQPIQTHMAGTQSCLRSAQCRRRTRRKCRSIRRNHQHSSRTPPRCCQAPCQAHTPRTHHSSQRIPPRTAGTASGPHSAPDPRRNADTHRLCRPCQRHSSRTTSWPGSVCRRHRIPCTSHLIQQTPRRTGCIPHASQSRRCRQGSGHKCRRSQQSPPHSPGTSAHPPWARTQQHTGCTLRSR